MYRNCYGYRFSKWNRRTEFKFRVSLWCSLSHKCPEQMNEPVSTLLVSSHKLKKRRGDWSLDLCRNQSQKRKNLSSKPRERQRVTNLVSFSKNTSHDTDNKENSVESHDHRRSEEECILAWDSGIKMNSWRLMKDENNLWNTRVDFNKIR